jgi:hypothetical protein
MFSEPRRALKKYYSYSKTRVSEAKFFDSGGKINSWN